MQAAACCYYVYIVETQKALLSYGEYKPFINVLSPKCLVKCLNFRGTLRPTMRVRSLIVAALGAHIASAVFSDDGIYAQGLLGSHFGVPGIQGAFDYVVIGGGTAGLTTARRLAANASVTVAVIEAGDFYEFANGNLSQIPAYASRFTGNDPVEKNPYLDWYHYTEPQPVSFSPLLRPPQGDWMV